MDRGARRGSAQAGEDPGLRGRLSSHSWSLSYCPKALPTDGCFFFVLLRTLLPSSSRLVTNGKQEKLPGECTRQKKEHQRLHKRLSSEVRKFLSVKTLLPLTKLTSRNFHLGRAGGGGLYTHHKTRSGGERLSYQNKGEIVILTRYNPHNGLSPA